MAGCSAISFGAGDSLCNSSDIGFRSASKAVERGPRTDLAHVDGVMLGQAAYLEPWRLLPVDSELFGGTSPRDDEGRFAAMLPYIERQPADGTWLLSSRITSSGPSMASPARVPLAPRGERRAAGCEDRSVFRCDRTRRRSRTRAGRGLRARDYGLHCRRVTSFAIFRKLNKCGIRLSRR
jgi:hypothetical protein